MLFSQDGIIGVHDMRSHEMEHTISLAESGAVEIPSIVGYREEDNKLFACAAHCAFQVDLRQAQFSFPKPIITVLMQISVLERIEHGVQGSILQRYAFNSEEINSLAISSNGSYLAAADDSGEVKVIDLRTQQMHKTLRGCHDNICSAVAFRPHHPWDVMSGGLDARLVRWNFATGRPLRQWSMGVDEDEPSTAQVGPTTHTVQYHSLCGSCWCKHGQRVLEYPHGALYYFLL